MKRKLVCIALFAFASQGMFAQRVEGKLTDDGKNPLEFVNVVLLTPGDSAFVQGSVSDANGCFKIEGIENRPYILRASSVGYQTVYKSCGGMEDVGSLVMPADAVILDEAVITARRPTYQLKGSSLVANIQNTMLSVAGTANDVLKRIPGLQGDNGSFTVFGKGTPLIYINGRQVRDNSELDRLSSQEILSVELITNPGAEYDATVKSVLKIRTVKRTGEGFGVNARAYISQSHETSHLEQVNVNYRRGGLDLFATGQYSLWQQQQEQRDKHHVLTPDVVWDQSSEIEMKGSDKSYYAQFGVNYDLNENHSLGATYDLNGTPSRNFDFNSDYRVLTNGEYYDRLKYTTRNKAERKNHKVNAYYAGQAGKWNIDFNADLYMGDDNSDQHTDEDSEEQDDRLVTSTSGTESKLYAAKLVVKHPLGSAGEITFGAEYTYVNRLNRYNNPQNLLPETDNEIDEQNLSAFAGYAAQWGKLQAEAGVRYEHVIFDYYNKGIFTPEQSRNYDNLFPNVGLSLPIGKVQTALSYTAKTRRPYYQELRSDLQYGDRFTYEGGNPLLQPETNHDITLMASYKWIQASLSYQYRKDAIQWTAIPYEKDPSVSVMTYMNFDKAQALNASLSLSPKFGLWEPVFSVYAKKPFFKTIAMGEMRSFNQVSAYFSFNNSFRLGEAFYLNVNGNFSTRGNDGVVLMKPSGRVDISLYKAFMKDRFSLNLQCFDVFASQRSSFTFYGTSMSFDKWNYSDTRRVCFTVRYKFNAMRSKYKGTGAGQDEMRRL